MFVRLCFYRYLCIQFNKQNNEYRILPLRYRLAIALYIIYDVDVYVLTICFYRYLCIQFNKQKPWVSHFSIKILPSNSTIDGAIYVCDISCVISSSFWRSHLVCDISCVISSSFWRSHLVCDISCVISSSFWRSHLVCDISCVISYATNRSRRNQMLLSVVWEAKVHTQCVEWPWTHPWEVTVVESGNRSVMNKRKHNVYTHKTKN